MVSSYHNDRMQTFLTCRTVLGDDLVQTDIKLESNGFYYKSRRCYGVCQVIIFPPANCTSPKLYTNINGKYVGVLCRFDISLHPSCNRSFISPILGPAQLRVKGVEETCCNATTMSEKDHSRTYSRRKSSNLQLWSMAIAISFWSFLSTKKRLFFCANM